MAKDKQDDLAKGFLLFVDDWTEFLEDFTPEEVVAMLSACISYHRDGILTEFDDRGMKRFYRDMVKSIDYSHERYLERCVTNAYSRYKGICKEHGIDALPKEQWYRQKYLPEHPTIVDEGDERQQSLPDVTNISISNNESTNESTNTNNNTSGNKVVVEDREKGYGEKGKEPIPYEKLPKKAKEIFNDWVKAKDTNNDIQMRTLGLALISNYQIDPEQIYDNMPF